MFVCVRMTTPFPLVFFMTVAWRLVTAQRTTVGSMEKTDISGFLSRTTLMWIVIGLGAALAVTCLIVISLVCAIFHRKRRATTFTVNPQIHGDVIRRTGSPDCQTDTTETDRPVEPPQTTVGESYELTPIDHQPGTDGRV